MYLIPYSSDAFPSVVIKQHFIKASLKTKAFLHVAHPPLLSPAPKVFPSTLVTGRDKLHPEPHPSGPGSLAACWQSYANKSPRKSRN
jgi:hypothetical protein